MWIRRKKIIAVWFLFFSFFAFGGTGAYPFQAREPFRPLVGLGGRILIDREGPEGMSLEGIIYSQESPAAIISGEILKQGQSIGGFTVSDVERDRVILEKEGSKHILKLEGD